MHQIAQITGGRAYWARGGPEEYTPELDRIFREIAVVAGCNPCDANCDGTVSLFDIDPFVAAIETRTGCSACAGDTNTDGTINLFDIQGFVDCLTP